jgi:type VI secretion system secreted protein VgrG
MAQPHAGPNYGHHHPLKPGTEVLIGFIDGDPDRPIILATVPNPVTPSPVAANSAPAHRIKTATGILIEMKDA